MELMAYPLKYVLVNRFSANERKGPVEPHRLLLGSGGAIRFIVSFIYVCSVATPPAIFIAQSPEVTLR